MLDIILIFFSQFEFKNLYCLKWSNNFNCKYIQVPKALNHIDPAQM